MDAKRIKLEEPITAFNQTFSELVLKEPRGSLYARLGEPRIGVVSGGTGGGYWVDQTTTINSYIHELTDIPDVAVRSAVLSQTSLADQLELKTALLDFFLKAEQRVSAKV